MGVQSYIVTPNLSFTPVIYRFWNHVVFFFFSNITIVSLHMSNFISFPNRCFVLKFKNGLPLEDTRQATVWKGIPSLAKKNPKPFFYFDQKKTTEHYAYTDTKTMSLGIFTKYIKQLQDRWLRSLTSRLFFGNGPIVYLMNFDMA